MKKKILFMINSMGVGGAEKSLLSLLSLLDYDKYSVDLQMFTFGGELESLLPNEVNILPDLDYSSFCKKPMIKQLLSLNFRYIFYRIKTALVIKNNPKRKNLLRDAQAYWKGCGKAYKTAPKNYDVAIAWGQGNPTHYIAEKVTASKKYAWINANYLIAGYNKDFDRKYYAVYDKNICVSNELAALFKDVFPEYAEKTDVVLDIQNPELIFKMSEEVVVLPRTAQTTIVTTGRLAPQKNYELAINTAKMLKDKDLDFVWYAVGDGPMRKYLEQQIIELSLENTFILLGSKTNPYPYMKAADVYVQTSSSEGYCLTLAEARMLNRFCVTTNFDVVYEQMVHGKNGLVVEMSPRAVCEGILEILNNQTLREEIYCYLTNEKKGNTEEIKKVEGLLEGC